MPHNDGPPLDLQHICIFATMNPASVGGGRNRLPRSARNLFTTISLQKPSEAEVRSIALDVFGPCLSKGLIDQQHTVRLLNFHQAAVTAAERRDLGRGGAAAEFNLRDLIKVRDIMWATMQDELHHIQMAAASDTPTSPRPASSIADGASGSLSATRRLASSSVDIRVQVLCKVLGSIYAARFSSSEDQLRVQHLIAEHMEVADTELLKGWGVSLECGVPSMLRVGAVYLSKGG